VAALALADRSLGGRAQLAGHGQILDRGDRCTPEAQLAGAAGVQLARAQLTAHGHGQVLDTTQLPEHVTGAQLAVRVQLARAALSRLHRHGARGWPSTTTRAQLARAQLPSTSPERSAVGHGAPGPRRLAARRARPGARRGAAARAHGDQVLDAAQLPERSWADLANRSASPERGRRRGCSWPEHVAGAQRCRRPCAAAPPGAAGPSTSPERSAVGQRRWARSSTGGSSPSVAKVFDAAQLADCVTGAQLAEHSWPERGGPCAAGAAGCSRGRPPERRSPSTAEGVDTHRFPWLVDGREPTEAERHAAVVSTAAQIASRRILTARANEAKAAQEDPVRAALTESGFLEVPARVISTLRTAPSPGEFCGESMLGSRKADVVIGLLDDRVLAVECKVSNFRLNSVKRIKNDAAVKAKLWIQEFGDRLIVPAAVIAGVYHPPNLVSAQRDGLTIWWSHDIAQMVSWIDQARPGAG
jgi:XamI restriction endonuclease